MKININIKGYSQKKASILKMSYDYISNPKNVRELLEETVKITLDRYMDDRQAGDLLKALSNEEIEEEALSSKISFGVRYNENHPDETKAIENALQCFEDGMVALFINGRQYEDIDEEISLKENDEISFIRLTFLAGRMW